MKSNRKEHSRFVQWLDRTAEKNPVLWLPCVVLLVIALGAENICGIVSTAFPRREKICVSGGKADVQLVRKPFVLRVVALMLAFSLVFALNLNFSEVFGITAYAYEGTPGAEMSNNEYEWHEGWNWGKSTTSIDYLDFNDNYFVRIDNNDYSDQSVDKKVRVKPNTKYRLSAMVKTTNFAMNPQEAENSSGASVGISWTFEHSDFLTDNEWRRLEYCFDTNNETEVTLALRYGMFGSTCRGTAWFTNIELEEYTQPENSSRNIGQHDYNGNAFHPVNSYLTEQADGTFERVEYIENSGVVVEKYLGDERLVTYKTIPAELPRFGGFFSGRLYNFVVFGQENPSYSNDVEVLRIVKYSKNWEKLEVCSVYGANSSSPINGGTLSMDETGNKLVIHTCHTMYPSGDGVCHQANMTFTINTTDMTVEDCFYDVMNIEYGYSSHSFNQYVKVDNDMIYRVDHGDAYPRSVVLTKAPVNNVTGVGMNYVELLKICGQTGDNATGVSIGGFELSDFGFMVAGNSVDQSDPLKYSPNEQRNVFISPVNSSLSNTETIFLTHHLSGVNVGNPYIVKINDSLFAIMWEETINNVTDVKYLTVDSKGNIVSPMVSISTRLSDCQPIIVNGNRIMWYYTDNWSPTFVTIDFYGNIDTGHNISSSYSSDGIGHWFNCADCSEKIDYAEHIVNIPKAVPGESQKCVICGYVIEGTSTHIHSFSPEWNSDSTSHWHECSCGERADSEEHRAGEAVVTVQPTETTEGVRTYSCEVCGYVMRTDTISPIDETHIHYFGTDWKYDSTSHWHECSCGEHSNVSYHIENGSTVTVQPTAFSTGIRTYFCTVCGYPTRTETIPATGISHDPSPIYPTPIYPEPVIVNPVIPEPIVIPDNVPSPVTENLRDDITITLDCDLSGLPSGEASIRTKCRFFENSAEVCLTNDVDADSAGERAMAYLNNDELICYPFDISIYSADNGSQMSLMNNGYITFEIPVPKAMAEEAVTLKVYHIRDGIPEIIESTVEADDNGVMNVIFTASEFSPYMFTAVAGEDISSGAGVTSNAVSVDMTTPVSNGVAVPAARLPQIKKYSCRKRRYRILRRRRLDDMTFVY